jgi:hypothetical protein
MHRLGRVIIGALFSACLISSCTPHTSQRIISLSSLPAGDMIEVRVEIIGCFKSSLQKLIFHVAPPQVEIYEIPRNAAGNIEQNWVKLGDLDLNSDDLRRLDIQLAYYRKNHHGSCTTSTTIDLTQFHDGKGVISEHWADYSCASSMQNRSDILWFNELIMRAYKKNKSRYGTME